MEDVTGFNQKSQEYDGEKLIYAGVTRLKQRYTESFTEILRQMLKFNENDRLSFIELAKMFMKNKPHDLV